MGGWTDGGDENQKIPKFCFGPKIVPKDPFGVGIGPFGPKNHEESESGLKKPIFFQKKNVFSFFCVF